MLEVNTIYGENFRFFRPNVPGGTQIFKILCHTAVISIKHVSTFVNKVETHHSYIRIFDLIDKCRYVFYAYDGSIWVCMEWQCENLHKIVHKNMDFQRKVKSKKALFINYMMF
jgi:hypothetical protein